MIGGFKCKAELKFLESVINLNKNRGIKGSRCLNYHKSLVANQIRTRHSDGTQWRSESHLQHKRAMGEIHVTSRYDKQTKYSKPGNLWKK